MTAPEDISTTVKKLLAVACDSGASPSEQATAMAKARDLMARHGIRMDDVVDPSAARRSTAAREWAAQHQARVAEFEAAMQRREEEERRRIRELYGGVKPRRLSRERTCFFSTSDAEVDFDGRAVEVKKPPKFRTFLRTDGVLEVTVEIKGNTNRIMAVVFLKPGESWAGITNAGSRTR